MKTLFDQFYRIHSTEYVEPATWHIGVTLNPAHAVYRGHFPAHPVVPGVCMLQVLQECVSEQLGKQLHYKSLSSCKFLSVVDPQQTPGLRFSFSLKEQENDTWQLSAEGEAGETLFIKLKGILSSRRI